MADLDNEIAGLRCRDVLDLLADYVEGELDPSVSDRVDAHLRECDACEKFGGEYADLVTRLRAALPATATDPSVRERLGSHMKGIWTKEIP